jgi:hypothetical protein
MQLMPSLAFHCGTRRRPELNEKLDTSAAMLVPHRNSLSGVSCEQKFFTGIPKGDTSKFFYAKATQIFMPELLALLS